MQSLLGALLCVTWAVGVGGFCFPGSYSSSGTCFSCAAGKYSSTGVTCSDCAVGSYSGVGWSACFVCVQGTYASGVGSTTCTGCAAGKFVVLSGASACTNWTDCAPGTYVNGAGSVTSNRVCGPCFVVGQYCPVVNTPAMLPCPSGTYSDVTSATACKNCLAGYRNLLTTGSSACYACPAGSYSTVAGVTLCSVCAAGTYASAVASTVCSTCGAGTYVGTTGASVCVAKTNCPVGWRVLDDLGTTYDRACVECTAGTICPVINSPYGTLCPGGTYSSSGASVCLICPSGTRSNDVLMSSGCIVCAAGTYASTSSTVCTACVAGKYGSGTGLGVCPGCPVGSYTGLVGATVCSQCVAGKYAGVVGASVCTDCAVGTYVGTTGASVCVAKTNCPVGWRVIDDLGTTYDRVCVVCTAGTICPVINSPYGTLCPGGTYSSSGASVCLACSPGTRSNDVLMSSGCIVCAAGTYSIAQSSACTTCVAGTYSSASGLGACSACPAGSYSGLAGMTMCNLCAVGTYGSAAGSSVCLGCVAGKYAASAGVTSCTNWTDCLPGSYVVLVPDATKNRLCMSCYVVGTYCPVVNIGAMLNCPLGTYSDVASASVCKDCPAGTRTPFPTGSWYCVTCSQGTYSLNASSACATCPAGSVAGSFGASSCTLCAAGTYTSAAGGNLCLPCLSGKYASSQNSSSCTAIGTCGPGTYIKTVGSSVANVVCGACKANCSAGEYLQGSCAGLDFSDVTRCVACLSSCPAGQYLSFNCTGAERTAPTCRQCNEKVCPTGTYYGACVTGLGQLCPSCKTCSAGNYTSQCGGTFEGVCSPCTNCSRSGLSAISNCTSLSDTVCAGGVCGVNVSCPSGMFCNHSTGNASGCAARWTFQSDSTYLCVNTSISGVCLPCPKGWTANGSFCLPCREDKSCTVAGVAACEGACQAGYSPSCDQATGRVVCTRCEVNQAVQDAGNRVVTRGGILDRPDLCDAYFQCKVGYVLTVTKQYTMVCVPCRITEPNPSMFVFFTHGLTTGDVYSCLYRRAGANVSANALGTYGVYSVSCPLYTTAEARMAANASQCTACAAAPDGGALIGSSAHCRFTCNAGYSQIGFGCVSAVRFDCTVSGYFVGSDGRCWANPLPWNLPGNSDRGGLDLLLGRWADDPGLWPWDGVSLDADSMVYSTRLGVRAVAATLGGVASEAALCNGLAFQEGSTFRWGVSDAARDFYIVDGLVCDGDAMLYYTVYMVAKGPIVYKSGLPWLTETVLLQRGFGVYNQWRLWLLLRSTYTLSSRRGGLFYDKTGRRSRRGGLFYDKGDVGGSWELPGKVCAVVLGPGTLDSPYWFLHFCGSFSISVATVVSPSQGLRTWVSDPLRFGLLAGGGEAGNRDGFRDEARFGSSLSMALAPGTGVLLVADRYNCRLAEVRFAVPGAFDTAVYTLYQGCYSPAAAFPYQTLAIPFPRLLTAVFGGSMFLFVTDDGLMQLDWGLRQIQLLAGSAYLPPNAIAVGMANWKDGVVVASNARAYDYSVNVYNATHYVMLTATQLGCPAGSVSFAGGACVPCPPRTFARGNVCVVCGGVSSCAAGSVLISCNATTDARCGPCPAPFPAGVAFRWVQGCVARMAAPCPVGYYAEAGGLCSACPQWSNTSRPNATSIRNCTCVNGGVLNASAGVCNVSSPWPRGVGAEVVPDWLSGAGCGIDDCPLRACYLAWVSPRMCRACPSGTVGNNGMWCSPCGVGLVPNPSLDLCVCSPPGIAGAGSVGCVCPAGYVGSTQGCVRCPENTVSLGGGDVAGGDLCVECPAGKYSASGASSCVACAFGTYRERGMALCSRCANPRAYATDPASVDSCVSCIPRGGCGLGKREVGCPVNDSLVTCTGCRALLPGEHWVDAAYNTNCLVACDDGWWSHDGVCVPCSVGLRCRPGWSLSACTAFSDAGCDVECFNATMPVDNSEWSEGCAWRCADGYIVVEKNLAGWVEYTCELSLSVYNWGGWF